MGRIRKTLQLAVGTAMALATGDLAGGEPLDVGAAAPEVEALNQDGVKVSLGELYKKGLTLVYFYPKADTPGCTKQACSLRDAYEKLLARGIQVVGVSGDDVAAQKAFQEKYRLPFPLLADSDRKVMEAFGDPHLGGFA